MPIISVSEITDVLKHVTPQDRIYVDLDETLVRTEPDASPDFERAFQTALEDQGVQSGTARIATCEIWQGMQDACQVNAVEESTLKVLQALRSKDIEIIGLTARSPQLIAETMSHLDKSGLSSVFDSESLGVIALSNAGDSRPPLTHERGIIYCTGSRKPQAMLAFEAKRPTAAVRLVLIDDLRAHLDAVDAALTTANRAFLGLHYTFLQEHTAKYKLPQLAVRLASVLANQKGRNYMLKAIERLGSEFPQPVQTKESQNYIVSAGSFFAGAAIMYLAMRLFAKPRF